MKYGLAIMWEGPCAEKKLDDGYAAAVYDCVLLKLDEINHAMLRNNLPVANYTVIARDEKDLKKTKK
jgi:hypothetical protein